MPIYWIFTQPVFFLVWIVAVVVALTIHEFSHAAAAAYFGDNTAKLMGRLSLNPIVHIDPLGFFMLVFVGLGWAKPVPVNPYNLRNSRFASGFVAAAGPISNLAAIIVFGLVIRFLTNILGPENLLINFLFMLVLINAVLLVFNLIPIPPLDGSKVLFSILPDSFNDFKYKLSINGPWILFMVILFDSLSGLGLFGRLFVWFFNFLTKFI